MKYDMWERLEADVAMAYMAASMVGNVPNDISLIVDMKYNIT